MKISVLLGAVGAATVAASAQGAAFFTYADPSGGREVEYTAPVNPGDDGFLFVSATVDFTVDLTEHGLGVLTFDDATFVKTAYVGPATAIIPGIFYTAEVLDGYFRYETAGGDMILEGSFDGADLNVLVNSGSLVTNPSPAGGGLTYNYGSPLTTAFQGSGYALGDAIDASWTLTAITNVAVLPNGYFDSFEANAAFTGTAAVVPTPGAISLALAGVAFAGRRNKR